MKTAGLLVLLVALTQPGLAQSGPAAAQPAKPSAEGLDKLSPGMAQLLTDKTEKDPAPASENPAVGATTDVLELPKITITQKKRPRLGDDVMMTPKAFNDQLAKEKLSSFDRNFLNKYTLPLFGTSAAARAREEYEREKREQFSSDVARMAKVVEQIDPVQAKALRDAAAKP